MNELDALELILNECEEASTLPAYTRDNLEDHETEVILIDNWTTNRVVRTNKPFRGARILEDGGEVELHFYHEMRVDLRITSDKEQSGMEYREELLEHFRKYEYRVRSLHDDMVTFEVGDGGRRSTQFEPQELRVFNFVQTLEFEFVDRVILDDYEILEEIEDDIITE